MAASVDTSIACIGAGYWGKSLVRNVNALGMLSCVCETSPERRALLAGKDIFVEKPLPLTPCWFGGLHRLQRIGLRCLREDRIAEIPIAREVSDA